MPDGSESTIPPGLRTGDTEGEKHPLAIASTESGLIDAGPCRIPPPFEEKEPAYPVAPSEETPRDAPSPTPRFAFLPWESNGLKHGLKRHKIAKNGYVYETGDRPMEPRRKSKSVSSRQWVGR